MDKPENTLGIDWTGQAYPPPAGRSRTPAAIARRKRCVANRARKRAETRGEAWCVQCAYDGPFGLRGEVLKGFPDYVQAARYAAHTDPGGSWLRIREVASLPQEKAAEAPTVTEAKRQLEQAAQSLTGDMRATWEGMGTTDRNEMVIEVQRGKDAAEVVRAWCVIE